MRQTACARNAEISRSCGREAFSRTRRANVAMRRPERKSDEKKLDSGRHSKKGLGPPPVGRSSRKDGTEDITNRSTIVMKDGGGAEGETTIR